MKEVVVLLVLLGVAVLGAIIAAALPGSPFP
jgi:hypothetical protein